MKPNTFSRLVLALGLPLFAQGAEELTRIAVLPVEGRMPIPSQTALMTDHVRKAFTDAGAYYVVPAEEMSNRQRAVNQKVTAECRTEQCALEAGQLFAVSKVVVGELENDKRLYILTLKMFDLEKRSFEAKSVTAAAAPEEKWGELAAAGVQKLMGINPGTMTIDLVNYKGREVHNQKEWYILGGVTLFAAFSISAINGSFSPEGEKNDALTVGSYDLSNLSYAYGAFGTLPLSARAHGMGGAFIGLSDDANAMAFNPAGMTRVRNREITAGFLRYRFGDLGNYPYFYTGYVNQVTRTLAHGQALITSSGSAFGSSETQVVTSVAKLFDEFQWFKPFSLGLNVRFLMMAAKPATNDVYAWQEYAVQGGGFGAAFDFGGQMAMTDRITAGFLIRDFASYLKYKNTTTGENYREGTPLTLAIGGHYRIFESLNLVLDGYKSYSLDTDDHVRMGVEKWLFNLLAIRLGMSQNFSFDSHRRGHFGVGIKKEFGPSRQALGVDYSYEYFPLSEGEYTDLSGSQRFALNYRF